MGGKRKQYQSEECRDTQEIVRKRASKKVSPFECVIDMLQKECMPTEHHSESTNDTIEGFQMNKNEQLKGKKSPAKQTKQQLKSKTNESEEDKDQDQEIEPTLEVHKPQEIFDCKYLPEQISFRDKEKQQITSFIQRSSKNLQKNKCLLITGLPGCGKTLTTLSILHNMASEHQIEYFKFNAMSYNTQNNFLSDLHFRLFKTTSLSPSEDILASLKAQKRSLHLVLFIDEFDNLFSGNSMEIFTLFNIVKDPITNCSLIGVSNSMEMIFELSKKHKITLPETKNLVFEPYSQKEIYQIIQNRLKEARKKLNIPENISIIDDKALRLCSGKMYNLKGGDIRCLFDVCKKALQSAGGSAETHKDVSLPELNAVIEKLYRVNFDFICAMPTEQQLAILAIYQVLKKDEGIIEISFDQVQDSLNRVCKSMCLDCASGNKLLENLESLQTYQILMLRKKDCKHKQLGEGVSVFLKITVNDIEDTLKSIDKFAGFFDDCQ